MCSRDVEAGELPCSDEWAKIWVKEKSSRKQGEGRSIARRAVIATSCSDWEKIGHIKEIKSRPVTREPREQPGNFHWSKAEAMHKEKPDNTPLAMLRIRGFNLRKIVWKWW